MPATPFQPQKRATYGLGPRCLFRVSGICLEASALNPSRFPASCAAIAGAEVFRLKFKIPCCGKEAYASAQYQELL